MADFFPPFAESGDRRLPTLTEQQQGFACGSADRALFDGLFHRLESQIANIATEAGVVSTQAGDPTLLTRAVIELIAQRVIDSIDTAGIDLSDYITMTLARARLPIFPDVQNSDGHLFVLSPSTGVVRVPGAYDFNHRGILRVTTAQTDFNTDPSKTYHLRWNPVEGFVLRDLASNIYNPTILAETNPVFDSTYDDMLVARVVTNSSNAVTVTNLKNRARLWEGASGDYNFGTIPALSHSQPVLAAPIDYNFARTPFVTYTSFSTSGGSNQAGGLDIGQTQYFNPENQRNIITRYNARIALQVSNERSVAQTRYATFGLLIQA